MTFLRDPSQILYLKKSFVVNHNRELIFQYKYLFEYKTKIENIGCTQYGSYYK